TQPALKGVRSSAVRKERVQAASPTEQKEHKLRSSRQRTHGPEQPGAPMTHQRSTSCGFIEIKLSFYMHCPEHGK
ncbi:hypothetical protein AVEN_69668-2-1, partial [Araneus ventricosus]